MSTHSASVRAYTVAVTALLLGAAAACAAEHALPSSACSARVRTSHRSVRSIDRLDLLFVLDSSPSMEQEQALLKSTTARIADSLLDRESILYGPPLNLHVGVITSNLGVESDGLVPGCSALGDDGRLRRSVACGSDAPPFIWNYQGYHDVGASKTALACLVDVGATGCSVSQPLEAALKALLPAAASADTAEPSAEPVLFADGTHGHGLDQNAGFLRPGSTSLLMIIVITDQDDCSIRDPTLFLRDEQLAAGDPWRGVKPALRCVLGEDKLQAVDRYLRELRGVRSTGPELVELSIIAGVPPDLVSAEAQNSVDRSDQASRERFYASILDDPRMQLRRSQNRDGTERVLEPSCTSDQATAYPPRRLIQLAQVWGDNVRVGSICEADPARVVMDLLESHRFVADSAPPCMPHELRDSSGRVPCRMTWTLPRLHDPEEPLTPAECGERPNILTTPGPDFGQTSKDGRRICEVRQAAATRAADGGVELSGEGFYFADFGSEALIACRGRDLLGFTAGARPPSGVDVALECVSETCTDAGGVP